MLPSVTTKPLVQVLSLLFTLVLWLASLRLGVLNGEVEKSSPPKGFRVKP